MNFSTSHIPTDKEIKFLASIYHSAMAQQLEDRRMIARAAAAQLRAELATKPEPATVPLDQYDNDAWRCVR